MKGSDMGFGMWLVPLLFVIIIFYVLNENNKGKKEKTSAQDLLDNCSSCNIHTSLKRSYTHFAQYVHIMK